MVPICHERERERERERETVKLMLIEWYMCVFFQVEPNLVTCDFIDPAILLLPRIIINDYII